MNDEVILLFQISLNNPIFLFSANYGWRVEHLAFINTSAQNLFQILKQMGSLRVSVCVKTNCGLYFIAVATILSEFGSKFHIKRVTSVIKKL